MKANRKHSTESGESGFSLVELMVVVLILGVLVSIAVLAYVRAQEGSKRTVAVSNLRTALASAKTLQVQEDTYLVTDTPTTVSKLQEVEPSLTWQEAPSTAPAEISVTSDADTAALATKSNDGHCYYVVDDVNVATGGTTFGKSAVEAADCPPVVDTTAPDITWAETPKLAGW